MDFINTDHHVHLLLPNPPPNQRLSTSLSIPPRGKYRLLSRSPTPDPSDESPPCPALLLPTETWLQIASYLTAVDAICLTLTCRRICASVGTAPWSRVARRADRLERARLLHRLEGDEAGRHWLCYDCVALHPVRAMPGGSGRQAEGPTAFTEDWDDPDVHAHLDALEVPPERCARRRFGRGRRAGWLAAPHGAAASFLRAALEPALADLSRAPGVGGPPPSFRWWGYAQLPAVPRTQQVWRRNVGRPRRTSARSRSAAPSRPGGAVAAVLRRAPLQAQREPRAAPLPRARRRCSARQVHVPPPLPVAGGAALEQEDVARWGTAGAGVARRAAPALRGAWPGAGRECGAGEEDGVRGGVGMLRPGEAREGAEEGRSLRDAAVRPWRGEGRPLARLDPAHDAIWLDVPPDRRAEHVFAAACGSCVAEVFWSVPGRPLTVGAKPPFNYAPFELVSVRQVFEAVEDGDGGGRLVPLVPEEVESEEEVGLRRWFEDEFVDLLDVQWSWDFGCRAPAGEYPPTSLAALRS